MELEHLKNNLDEKNAHASSTATVAEQYLRELVDVRIKLGSAQEVAETNAMAAAKAETQCMMLMKEIEAKNEILQEHDAHVAELTDQLTYLQQEINTRELHQKELKEEVLKLEREAKLAALRVAASKDLELKRVLEEISIRNSEQLSKLVNAKDDEISRMKEEIRLLSAQLRLKAQELETQVEKHRAADQELKKRVVKLEFWLQEARNQTRKFQKIIEKREKELKDLQAQLASNTGPVKVSRSVWNDQRLKVIMSITVVVLALFARH
ncbi:hypothetical protein KP509_02G057600 [Ceratopteris richardii]|nr:hypothetical protein KP509_02G057600 [Ceratopteris richardii]